MQTYYYMYGLAVYSSEGIVRRRFRHVNGELKVSSVITGRRVPGISIKGETGSVSPGTYDSFKAVIVSGDHYEGVFLHLAEKLYEL